MLGKAAGGVRNEIGEGGDEVGVRRGADEGESRKRLGVLSTGLEECWRCQERLRPVSRGGSLSKSWSQRLVLVPFTRLPCCLLKA